MRIPARLLAAVLVAVLAAACGPGGAGGDAAAVVGDDEIPRDLLERIVSAQVEAVEAQAEQQAAQQGGEELSDDELDEQAASIQTQILTVLITFEVFADIAEQRDIEVSDQEVEQAFEAQVEAAGGEEAFGEQLDTLGLGPDEFREVLVTDQVRQQALLADISDDLDEDELEEAFAASGGGQATRTVRHILLEDEDEAEEVVAELEDGADFAELAEERSQDPGSAERGGELDPAPEGSFVPAFDEAVFEAELDELVGPIETEFGFHVLEVIDENEPELDDSRDEIERQVAGQRLQGLLADAYEETDIEVAGGLGEWDEEQSAVVAPGRVGEPETEGGQVPGGQAPGGQAPGDAGGGGGGTPAPAPQGEGDQDPAPSDG